MKPGPNSTVLTWLDDHGDLAVPAIALAELRFGVARLPDGKRRSSLHVLLDRLVSERLGGRVLAFDGEAAAYYGDLSASRERAGVPISSADAQIAAICRAQSVPLATRNTRDFLDTGVRLINPWDAPRPD